MIWDNDDRAHQAWRKANFNVKVEPTAYDPSMPDEFTVSVTHNGYQWYPLSFTPDEARVLIAKVQEYLITGLPQ